MKFKAYKTVFDIDELGVPYEDFDLLPEAMLDVFHKRVRNHEARLLRLTDQFAIAIYNTHIAGSILFASQGMVGAKDLVENAEPEAIREKAWAYAKVITEQEYNILLDIIADMKTMIKEAKETKGGIN